MSLDHGNRSMTIFSIRLTFLTGYNYIFTREHEGTERDTEGVGCDLS